jgi:uncharacterized protein YndB with AHSA1/START domain
MVEVKRTVAASPDAVFSILADGWSYAGWVVGNSHIRRVDPEWPAEGSRIHHSAGMWPVMIPDVSTVVAVRPARLLELEARLWMLGRVRIRFTMTPAADGSTELAMEEEVVAGPASIVPVRIQALFLRPRNREALARLVDLVAR